MWSSKEAIYVFGVHVAFHVALYVIDINTAVITADKSKNSVIGATCKYTNSCVILDENLVCGEDKVCVCKYDHHPQINSNGTAICLAGAPVTNDNTSLWALVSAVGGLLTFGGLICLALKLYSSGRLNEPRGHYANAGAPSVILTDTGSGAGNSSRRTSKASRASSVSHPSASRRASYTMLAPPSRTGSRRTSTTSLRSQSSFRANPQSSFRGQFSGSFKDNMRRKTSIRRTSSSPVRPRSPYSRRIMSHEVLTLNCDHLKPGPSKFVSEEKLGNHLSVTSHEI